MNNEVKDHLVVVHTKNNSVGHVTIEIMGPVIDALPSKSKPDGRFVRGFYPSKVKGGVYGLLSVTTIDVPGMVKDDAEDWNEKVYMSSQAIAITKSQAGAMIAHATREQRSPSKYDLNDHNCVDFGNDMLRAGGVPGDVSDYLTQEQMNSLNGARVYASIVYGSAAKGRTLNPEQRRQARHGKFFENRAKKALSPQDVLAEYAKQGVSPPEAVQQWAGQVSKGGYGQEAAELGLAVREAQAIFDTANDIDIRNRGFSGTEMIAAERYRTAFERTNDKDAALESAREGLAAARNYEGPSQEFSLGEPQLSSERISSYIDTFRDEVELSRVRGDSISGVPEGGVVSAGSQNSAAVSQQYSPENLMTAEQNQRQLETQQEKRQKGPRTVTINVPRQDYLSGQTEQGAARAARSKIDTTGLNVDLLNIAVPKTRPGQYEVTLGGWSPVRTLAALSRATAKRTPSRKASMTTAHQKALDTRYGYRDPNDPNTPQNQRGYRSFGGWMNAMKDAVSTGWYGNPNKNPNKSVIETGVTQTGTSAQGLIDAQENIDKDLARRQKQERQKQQKEPAPTTESDEQSTTMTSNTKTDLLGGSVNATLSGPQALGGVATAPRPSRRSNKRQKVDLLKDKKGTVGQVAGTASGDGNDKGNDGDSGSSGAPDSGAYEGAVSAAADDPNLSDDDFWSGYEAGTAAYDKANSDGKSGSGKIVCTAMNARYGFGGFRNTIWLKYSRDHLSPYHETGYHTLFLPLVDFAYTGKEGLVRRMTRRMLEHIARHRTKDIWFEMRGHRRDIIGRVERVVLEPLCFIVGWLKSWA